MATRALRAGHGRSLANPREPGNAVDGIDDDIEAEPEGGDGKLMDHGIALDPDQEARSCKRCLCRINPQVAGPQVPGERCGQRRPAGSGTSRRRSGLASCPRVGPMSRSLVIKARNRQPADPASYRYLSMMCGSSSDQP